MSRNEYSSSLTGHSGFVLPDNTKLTEKVNFVYVTPELIKLVKNHERKLKRQRKLRKSFLDHYLYFCGTISYLVHVDKRYKNFEFVPINREIMTSIISKEKFTEIKTNLIKWNVIETTNSYQTDTFSTGFKLLSPYNQTLKKTMITDNLINRKINEYKRKELQKLHELPYPYQYLEWTNTWIEMDTREATNYNLIHYFGKHSRKGKLNAEYDSNLISISDYTTKDYRFTSDEFGNRVHTNLTNLNSEFRYTLSVQGEKLGQVDISNSQPLFLYTLIKDNPQICDSEKHKYKTLVESGNFYEHFMKQFNIPNARREYIKQKVLTGMFSDKNRTISSRYFNYFSEDYPQIADYITETKRKDYKQLICLMQREESRFVIEKTVAEFINKYEGKFISTIHDSIVVKSTMLETVEKLMMECFQSEGIKPKLKIKVF